MKYDKKTYRNGSVEVYLAKCHQDNAIKRLPTWMDSIEGDIAAARKHVNQLYRWVLWLSMMTLVLNVILVLWLILGGGA